MGQRRDEGIDCSCVSGVSFRTKLLLTYIRIEHGQTIPSMPG